MLRWLRGCKGQELVEYAIILPVLLMLLLGIAEFSVLVLAYDSVANAAREGARLRRHPPDRHHRHDAGLRGPNESHRPNRMRR